MKPIPISTLTGSHVHYALLEALTCECWIPFKTTHLGTASCTAIVLSARKSYSGIVSGLHLNGHLITRTSVWATSVVEMLLYCHTYADWKSSLQHRKLKDHLVCYGGVKPYVCSDCPKSFYTARELKHHQPVHSAVKQFCCGRYGKYFRCKRRVLCHFKRCSGILPSTFHWPMQWSVILLLYIRICLWIVRDSGIASGRDPH